MRNIIRRTKIVTTLGPSTDEIGILKNIIQSGANILRLNFSHGNSEDHLRRATQARKIANKLQCFITLLGDLQGPKIRISGFKNKKIFLKNENQFTLNSDIPSDQGNEKEVGFNYLNLPNEVYKNDILLLDDGKIQLKVIKIDQKKIHTKIIVGGYLTNNKGLNKLGGGLSAAALTEKDKQDIKLAAKIDVDYLAVSFPRTGKDLLEARLLLKKSGSNAKIVAKIERAEAISTQDNIENIISESDVIMIARGDLGIEIGDEKLIGVQKNLIKIARKLNKATITATQMMESMIENPFPTRAEVMDVANAVLDGTDAVMLSAETASGKFPIETIQSMSKICIGAEKVPCTYKSNHRLHSQFYSISEAISMAAMYTANHLKSVSVVIIIGLNSDIALLTSRVTSGLPIFYFSDSIKNLNISNLYRGIIPIYLEKKYFNDQILNKVIHILQKRQVISQKDKVVILQKEPNAVDTISSICKILEI